MAASKATGAVPPTLKDDVMVEDDEFGSPMGSLKRARSRTPPGSPKGRHSDKAAEGISASAASTVAACPEAALAEAQAITNALLASAEISAGQTVKEESRPPPGQSRG